jgi:hypothetical protein
VHAEGERVFITRPDGSREEVTRREAAAGGEKLPEAVCPVGAQLSEEALAAEEPAPGVSALDEGLHRIAVAGKEAAHEAPQG